MKPLIKLENITKSYGENKVLDNISLEIGRGEIIGLIGANGSGKSTLLNILSGGKQIESTGGYSGDIVIDGNKVPINTYKDAIDNGIGMVHQELSLISNLDVASNITITREKTVLGNRKYSNRLEDILLIDAKENHKIAKGELGKLGVNIDTRSNIDKYPMAIKQIVEIARELNKRKLKLLMLDEPTSSLNKESSEELLGIIREIKESGTSVIFISHRLDEVMNVCDKVVVLRDGLKISEFKRPDFDLEKISLDMIGKSFSKATRGVPSKNKINSPILEFVIQEAHDSHRRFENLRLEVNDGEILGVTSLAGHGQSIFAHMVMGMSAIKGDINYKENRLKVENVEDTIRMGIISIVEDRKGMGLLLNRSIEKNIIFTAVHGKNEFLKKSLIKPLALFDKSSIKNQVDVKISQMNIKCSSPKQRVMELSGGNQQKVCFARALLARPKVLFIGEPTRGIDIFSKELILEMIIDINEKQNTTIVISSSEVEELKRVCDRVVVMYEGEISAVLSPEDSDVDFGLALSGQYKHNGGR